MSGAWSHDVFISYSHVDRDWARRVAESLRGGATGRSVYFDEHSLRAGDDWEAGIDAALLESQHFVLLWSDAARQSEWVTRELYAFNGQARLYPGHERRLVSINLQGRQPLTRFQHINSAAAIAAYPEASRLGAEGWRQLLQAVEEGLAADRRPIDVPVALLTLVDSEFGGFSPPLQRAIAEEFDFEAAALAQRYGASQTDWRPFDGSADIADLLERLRQDVNRGMPGRLLRWQFPPADFWTDIDAAQAFVTRDFLPADLSLLIIDPVAMHRAECYQRLMLFLECLGNSRTAIVPLPSFAMPRQVLSYRSSLARRTKPYFDGFFMPGQASARRVTAHCGWNISDADEMRRLMLAAAMSGRPEESDQAGNVFLAQRARRP